MHRFELNKLSSEYPDRINLRHSDHLYLMGDYIDRGPDSRGVLDIILHLMDSGYDVRPLCGNHEDMLIRCIPSRYQAPAW